MHLTRLEAQLVAQQHLSMHCKLPFIMPYYKYITYITYITEARSPTRYTTASFNAAVQVANHYYAILQIHRSSLLWLLLLTFDIHECMLEHIKTCRPCNGANQMQDAAENARKSENAKMQLLCNELGPAGPL